MFLLTRGKMKKQWIDIMFGDRWHRKFKYAIDTTFKTWLDDVVNYTLENFPYLRRRKEFSLWFSMPDATGTAQLVIRPKRDVEVLREIKK